MAQHLFQGLAVLFVDAEQEKRQHQADHQQRRRFVADTAPREKVQRDANQTAAAKADQLAGGQVKGNLVLNFGQVLRDRDKGHYRASSRDFCTGLSPGTGFAASCALMEGFCSCFSSCFGSAALGASG